MALPRVSHFCATDGAVHMFTFLEKCLEKENRGDSEKFERVTVTLTYMKRYTHVTILRKDFLL